MRSAHVALVFKPCRPVGGGVVSSRFQVTVTGGPAATLPPSLFSMLAAVRPGTFGKVSIRVALVIGMLPVVEVGQIRTRYVTASPAATGSAGAGSIRCLVTWYAGCGASTEMGAASA